MNAQHGNNQTLNNNNYFDVIARLCNSLAKKHKSLKENLSEQFKINDILKQQENNKKFFQKSVNEKLVMKTLIFAVLASTSPLFLSLLFLLRTPILLFCFPPYNLQLPFSYIWFWLVSCRLPLSCFFSFFSHFFSFLNM